MVTIIIGGMKATSIGTLLSEPGPEFDSPSQQTMNSKRNQYMSEADS